VSFKEKVINALFVEVTVKPKPKKRYKRETRFSWTSWTFGVWSAKHGRRQYIGVDMGPYSVVWREVLPVRKYEPKR
jgi:hypothetical protein